MKRALSAIIVLAIMMTTFLSLQGCQVPQPVPAPSPQPSAAAPTASPALEPTRELRPVEPSAPRILATDPQQGAQHRPTAPITLQFSAAMDRASVEKALAIEPTTETQISWRDDATLVLTPTDALERDTRYRVSVTSAVSQDGIPAGADLVFEFDTVGFLEVTQISPVDGSADVSTQTVIQIVFNRPVVPLTSIRRQEGLPEPLTIVPPVKGEGQWLNTSIYVFEPSETLIPGTEYSVTVGGGLTDTTGGVLEKDYSWSFVTERPRLADVSPYDGQNYVPAETDLTLVFSQPMDQRATEARFTLLDIEQNPVPGSIAWDGTTMTFTPADPLTQGGVYIIRLDSGAPAATGDAAIDGGYFGQFTVIEPPTVIQFSPQGPDVSPYQGLQITFTSPISVETLTQGLVITPSVKSYGAWPQEEATYYVPTSLEPSTAYTVTLTPDILGRDGDPLAEPYTATLHTRALDPAFRLDVPERVGSYNAYGTPTIRIEATNVSSLDISLYRISAEDFLWLNGAESWQAWRDFGPRKANLVGQWSRSPDAPLNETTALLQKLSDEQGNALGAGLYYVEVRSPDVDDYRYQHVLVVSHLNVTLKRTTTRALAWVTDLRDGVQVEGVPLTFFDEQGDEIGRGTTDNDGTVSVAFPGEPLEPWDTMFAVATYQDAATVHMGTWSRGVEPWDHGLLISPYDEEYRVYLKTERDIYRPGQTVYYKGIVRLDDDGAYSLPAPGQPITITIMDSQRRDVWTDVISLSEMGSFSGDFALTDDAALGDYRMRADLATAAFGASFQVAEYRKPEFEASLKAEQDEYVQGDTITATVEAHYYSGGPVANSTVRWTVSSSPYYFSAYAGDDVYTFWDYDYDDWARYAASGELLTEGSGRTDADGTLTISVPVELGEYVQSQSFVIEATVIDPTNQAVSARTTVIAHKGDIYIGLAPVGYLASTGDTKPVKVITVDTQGVTVPDTSVEITVLREEWYSVREEADDGVFYWTSKVKHTPIVTDTVTTGSDGTATFAFVPPEGGTYKISATALDTWENRVYSAAYVWVSDRDYVHWRQRNDDAVELVADRTTYRPGDTASILIPSPYEGDVTALLTIERGQVLEHRLLLLTSNSTQVEIPIEPSYAPTVYVSVMIVKGMDEDNPVPSFKAGYIALDVSAEQQELSVTVAPREKGPFQPRQEVTLDIDVRDYRGEGVEAEVTLKMVDRAVEALTGGSTSTIFSTFYGQRPLGVRTSTTLAISVDRHVLLTTPEGKGGGGGEGEAPFVRSDVPDTAYWAPAILTDRQGRASVTVTLPDNLTTWHVVGDAVTANTIVGTGDTDLVSTMDLLIRPVAPRFLVVGDEPVLGAVLHNNTDDPLDVLVTLHADGLYLHSDEESVSIPSGGQASVIFPAVVETTGEATLLYEASSAGHADAIEISLPILAPTSPEVVATAGQVKDSVQELVRLPLNVDPSQGELRITLETTLAAGMSEGLEYLESYPYQCIEQTVSRFLPNVATLNAVRSLGLSRPDLEEKLHRLVTAALQRLYAAQNLDGGWGWWPTQMSSPLITSYALLGLSEARDADFAVDAGVIDRSVQYIYKWLDEHPAGPNADADLRAFVLYTLAEAGEGDLGRTVTLYDARHDLSLYGQAYLAMSLQIMTPQETSRLDTLLNEFSTRAVLSATGLHWEEEVASPWAMNTDLRTTALVIQAIARLDPDNEILPNAVRWLMSMRREGHWGSTQENAWSILALTEYLLASENAAPSYDYTVWVNGVEQVSGRARTEDDTATVSASIPMSDLHVLGDNQIILERGTGPGNLYYSIFLKYSLPASEMRALDRGIIVQREYLDGDDPSAAIDGASAQDTVTVRLTIIAPHDLHYVVLEDPLPAGCEAIDPRLATTAESTQASRLQTQDYPYFAYDWARHTEFRDEKAVMFAEYLPKGTYEYIYTIRCTTPGEYQVLPATAYEMYQPDVFGRCEGQSFTIATD